MNRCCLKVGLFLGLLTPSFYPLAAADVLPVFAGGTPTPQNASHNRADGTRADGTRADGTRSVPATFLATVISAPVLKPTLSLKRSYQSRGGFWIFVYNSRHLRRRIGQRRGCDPSAV